jgi:hypothetical protein
VARIRLARLGLEPNAGDTARSDGE